MKIAVGYSKKVGLPDDGSLGATCGLEVELPEPDPHAEAGAFERRARAAFAACARAVQDELDRHRVDGARGDDAARPDDRRGRRRRAVRRRRPRGPLRRRGRRAADAGRGAGMEFVLRPPTRPQTGGGRA
ncbi:hypothetical protein [Planctomyces sp. SH-PL62]|uniref:hypothetical protein n=1 Tax=Planctomyces sp. SH-PL62 TaxID=1636152 RepID=UPI00078D1723|nr:hypothetical protein [Planctomyces sp. SH-PL62]AMV38426.1 hypothetical protein VT85_13395 [Planctomyces sp. SH-PL62]